MSNPKVVFEAVPSRWRVENRIRDGKWVGDQCFPTLEAATAYAQKWLDNNPDSYAYRVVDTQPEEVATGRRIAEDVITGDHQQAALRAIAAALHGDACPVDPDPGESCGCGDYEREAEIALTAAAPHLRAAWEQEMAEKIRAKFLGPDFGRNPVNGQDSPDAALHAAYDEGLQTALALLEGGAE